MLFPRDKAFWDIVKVARSIHGVFSGLQEKLYLAGYRERICEEQRWQKYAGQWHP